MRLLLDEQLSAVIATTLRSRGHDVVAIQEPDRADVRGLDDEGVFELAQQEGRAVVTDNIPHVRLLVKRSVEAGRPHFGVLYLNNRSLPRHRHDLFVSQVTDRLEWILEAHPGDDASSLEDFV